MSENTSPQADVRLGKYAAMFGGIGVIFTIITIILGLSAPETTLHSALFAVIVFLTLTLGCFGMAILQHIVQAKWGLSLLRLFEAGGGWKNLLLMMVLFIPIFIGAKYLYPWARAEQVHADPILQNRSSYFSWFYLRFVGYFLLWGWYAYRMRRSVQLQEASGKFREQQWRANWASPGLVFLILTVTLAYTDWVMSIDPHWYSTMYGLWFVCSMGLGGMAMAVLIVCLNAKKAPYNRIINPDLTRDYGNMLLTLTMLWAYTNFSQYLIIWSGNLPVTTTYLINRSLGHWNYLGFVIVLGQFFIPFFALLSPSVKATPSKLAWGAGFILLIRFVDQFSVIEPFYRPYMTATWTDLFALLGVGGLWGLVFSINVNRHPLLVSYDPRVLEVPEHAH